MALKHRKKLLAVEWTWLVTGSAVVFAFTVEAWAAPYVPVLWMLGMLALFFTYRFAISLYEINWPEPEKPAPGAVEHTERVGGDGIAGTVVYALPQMRGRSVPKERDKKRAEAASQIKVPSADGDFEDHDLDTVFGLVAEDTAPTPALGAGEKKRVKAVGRPGLFGVTVYEYEDLREETADDMTGTDLPIPSFAESQLTSVERAKALKNKQKQQDPLRMSAAVAAVVNRKSSEAPVADKSDTKDAIFGVDMLKGEEPPIGEGLRVETADDMTGIDVSIPSFAESTLTSIEREKRLELLRGGERAAPSDPTSSLRSGALNTKNPPARPKPKASAPPMLDELTQVDRPAKLDEMKLDEMRLDEMKLDEMKLDEITDDQIDLDKIVSDRANLDEKTRPTQTPSALNASGRSGKESP